LSRTETIKVRGLARLAAALFGGWGALVAFKGIYDLFWGEPEANLYAPAPWAFVTKEQWLRYGGFELVYGLACLGIMAYLVSYARFLPETIRRPAEG
jgi:hypothetical protein